VKFILEPKAAYNNDCGCIAGSNKYKNSTVILLSINSTAIPSQHLFPGVAWLSGIITL